MTSQTIETSMAKWAKWLEISNNFRATFKNRSLKICILMVNVGVPIRMFDDDLNWQVIKRCLDQPNEFKDLTILDLRCLSYILSISIDVDKEIVKKVGVLILNELINRLDSIASKRFYQNFVDVVRNLTIIDVYNMELFDNLLSPEYIKWIFKGSKKLDMPLYEIDGYCRINLKSIYKG